MLCSRLLWKIAAMQVLHHACPFSMQAAACRHRARTLVFSALPSTLSPVLPSVSPSFSRAVPNSDSCAPRSRKIS